MAEPNWCIDLLTREHARERFTCGVTDLTTYLRQYAMQYMQRKMSLCYVLFDADYPPKDVVGYYTLTASSVDVSEITPAESRKLPHHPRIPTALIGRLAVSETHQRHRFGELLLGDAVKRVLASSIAAYALEVDAIDERAAGFYRHFGFRPFASDPLRLYFPLTGLKALEHEPR